jgi:hypothetical protein
MRTDANVPTIRIVATGQREDHDMTAPLEALSAGQVAIAGLFTLNRPTCRPEAACYGWTLTDEFFGKHLS